MSDWYLPFSPAPIVYFHGGKKNERNWLGNLYHCHRGDVLLYRYQKERKKQEALLASVAVGDTVLTTSGFYGVIIDMTDDTVIVEFGNNKNCRIPMQKAAIAQLEKPTTAVKSDDKK